MFKKLQRKITKHYLKRKLKTDLLDLECNIDYNRQFCSSNKDFNKVSLIKVDVEGFEQPLLHGAIETIKSQRPALLISIYHNGKDFFEIKPWIESLNLGYRFKIRKAWDQNICRDTMLICETVDTLG